MNRAAIALAIFICLIPVLVPPDFPTQDGPSHIYNAAILRDYSHEPVYQQYYQLRFTPAGNLITQPLVLLLMAFLTPVWAAKMVAVIVVVALPLAFAYLLGAFTTETAAFTLAGSLGALNYFLQMGFWNFCYGVVVLLVAIGYERRGRSVWGVAGFSLALYFSHPLAWAVFAMYCGFRVMESRRWLTLLAHAPGAVIAVLYMARANGPAKELPDSIGGVLWAFYSLSFLHTRSAPAEAVWAMGVLVLVVALIIAVRRRPDALGWSAVGCVVVGIALHRQMAWDWYFMSRMALIGFLLFLAWCGSRRWSRGAQVAVGSSALVLLAWSAWIRLDLCRGWSAEVADYQSVLTAVEPGCTVLSVRLEPGKKPFLPLLHATGLAAPKPVIDLRNYEAASDHFLTAFRPERSPFPALGGQVELDGPLPNFDIDRYERQTQGRVDYLLFTGRERTETTVYSREMSRFRLVAAGSRARLYRRVHAPL